METYKIIILFIAGIQLGLFLGMIISLWVYRK
jgi:F0F1-type ATP synthase assembly protein I